jgi:predicted membrane-bound spermidine synthase
MSPTPSEVMSQRPGIRAARGRVLVGGMGMGWFAKEVARKPAVEKVVVVEQDPEIARYFGRRFADGPAVEVVVGDAYEVGRGMMAKGLVDSALFDIWPMADDAAFCPTWRAFKEECKAARVKAWGWGDFTPRD